MQFDDNFFEVCPNQMFDPALKLQLRTSPGPEAPQNTTALVLFYHPELRDEDFQVPNGNCDQKRKIAAVNLGKLDEILSRSIVGLSSIFMYLHLERMDHIVVIKVTDDINVLKIVEKNIESARIDVVSDHPRLVLIYALKSLSKLSKIRVFPMGEAINSDTQRIEVWISKERAIDYFELPPKLFEETENGWVRIASREIDR